MKNKHTSILASLVIFLFTANAHAASHLWRINEVFSNADGNIQFVEMHECCGAPAELGLGGRFVRSDSTGQQYDFTEHLTGNTADRYLLLATNDFAALPGAPTPDYIIPDNFFSTDTDTITYWFYPAATMTISPGDVPTNGVDSYDAENGVGPNTPTNYAGESGTVDASAGGMPAVPATSAWAFGVMTIILMVTGGSLTRARSSHLSS